MVLGDDIKPNITADWARKASKDVLSEKVSNQLKQTLEAVERAINKDEKYAMCGIYPHEKTIEILKQRGFYVEHHKSVDQRDSDYITIKW